MAVGTNITWTSPYEGDVYGPGDTIIGKWEAIQPAVSPSFELCMEGSGSDDQNDPSEPCGLAVWPTVKNKTSVYSISLTAPNVTARGQFYLKMKDDLGNAAVSPNFSLSPSSVAVNNGSELDPAPVSANTTAGSPLAPGLDSASPVTPTSTLSDPLIDMSTRVSTPKAAIAVPLAVLGTITLAALVFGIRHWHGLNRDRLRDVHNLSRAASMCSTESASSYGSADIEKALDVLSATHHYAVFVPPPPSRTPTLTRKERTRSYKSHMVAESRKLSPPSTSRCTRDPRQVHLQRKLFADNDDDSASITHSVISDYFDSASLERENIALPPKLHVRSQASCEYEGMPLGSPYEGKDIYAVVSKAVSSGSGRSRRLV